MNDKQVLFDIFTLTSQIMQKANELQHEGLKTAVWNTTRNLELTILNTILQWGEFYENGDREHQSSNT